MINENVFAEIHTKMNLFLKATVGLALMLPAVASADVYSWAFGGGSDPVSGSGTLTATATQFAGLDLITSGSGTVTYGGSTYNVDILPLVDAGNQFPGVHYGDYGYNCGAATVPNLPCATLQNPPLSGGANYTFDNLLYLNALPANSEVDANGIVLYNQAGPQTQEFFNLWSAGWSNNPLPDNFWATDTGNGWNNVNYNVTSAFSVSFSISPSQGSTVTATPEPAFYGVLALGLSCLLAFAARRRTPRRQLAPVPRETR